MEVEIMAEVAFMSPEELKQRLDAGNDMTVIDVREAKELNEGHIPGAPKGPALRRHGFGHGRQLEILWKFESAERVTLPYTSQSPPGELYMDGVRARMSPQTEAPGGAG